MKKYNWQKVFDNLQITFLFFIFMLAALCVFRAAFLFLFRSSLEAGVPAQDILLTFWYGARISLKTAGAFTLVPFVFGSVLSLFISKINAKKVHFLWGGAVILVLCVLFQFRLGYYKEFAVAFDTFLFNTFNDDVRAIVDTALVQYKAVWRLLFALVNAAVFCFIFKKFLDIKLLKFNAPKSLGGQIALACGLVIFVGAAAVFIRFGGSFTYNNGIYWKNAARLQNHLLNETVYDDIQALYRAKKTHEYLSQGTYNYADAAPDMDFAKTVVRGVKEKPAHIFLIVGETFMLWPLLEEYAAYHLADDVKELAAQNNAYFSKRFLPASNGTMASVAAIILGMADINLYPSFRESAKTPYETSLPYQMVQLGYETNFFYGGYKSWENIEPFAYAQGFKNLFFYGGLNYPKNAWGIEDKYFFEEVKKSFSGAKPSFNFILTSSNHAPLTVNISKERKAYYASLLSENLKKDKDLIDKMAHFDYAQRCIASFIKEMAAAYPDALFVLTGDHARRWHINPAANDYEKAAVPLLLLGKNAAKNSFPARAAASHIDITPALMEISAPRGHKYYALGSALLEQNIALGLEDWLKADYSGSLLKDNCINITGSDTCLTEEEIAKIKARAEEIRAASYKRVMEDKKND